MKLEKLQTLKGGHITMTKILSVLSIMFILILTVIVRTLKTHDFL